MHSAWLVSITRRVVEEATAERERWSLWLAVALGAGIAIYFGLPHEPATWFGQPLPAVLVLFLALFAAIALRTRPAPALLALAIAMAALGFAVAQERTLAVSAPVLDRQIGPVTVMGRVMTVERKGASRRLVLDHLTIGTMARDRLPATVRVSIPSYAPYPSPGMWIRCRAMLMPPPEPAVAGSFEFSRQAWFQRLGAVGYGVSKWRTINEASPPELLDRFVFGLARLRERITDRLLTVIGGEEGAIAATLLTGVRGSVPEDLAAAYRNTGIAHLLAIAGMHMSMVAGFVFVGLRGLLALVPPVALRYPIKKWTAVVALTVGIAYLLISGAAVPTQRAFFMASLIFVGILLDRRAISMRSLAWAAVVVMLWQPQVVAGPSFQMSFAAVVALIATYETLGGRLVRRRGKGSLANAMDGIGNHLAGILLTTLVAGSATAPYAAFHFGHITTYGMITNLIVVPITGVWIMPMGVIGLGLMPFGWDRPALTAMGWGIAVVNVVARKIAAWPGATFVVPPMPMAALIAISLGGLWLCLWRRRWRLLGIAPMVAGLVVPYLLSRPDVLISGDGNLMAVRAADGTLAISPATRSRLTRETWVLRYGDPARAFEWPDPGTTGAGGRLRCDSAGCIYVAGHDTLALVRASAALEEDCAAATVIVSAVPVPRKCQGPRLVIDRFALWRGGTHSLWLDTRPDGGNIQVETAAAAMGDRPWTPERWRHGGTFPPPEIQ
ncbi:MAG: ComEC/Rec2 family competence protein [Alphaproteobacteria bacterium]|nr:ComEC/Rec2 family competence protein [Alphaproteobacteria bacterium]